jgi:hypothetical protein
MKSVIAAVLVLAPFFSNAAQELTHNAAGSVVRSGSISVKGGTHDELVNKLSAKAEMSGSNFYRITHINTNNRGFATATLYNNVDMK